MTTSLNFIFSTVLFVGYSISSFAFNHLDPFLDNSDVTWAAEVYTDYAPNANHFIIGKKEMKEQYGLSSNTFTTLKIRHEAANTSINLEALTLAEQLLKMPKNEFKAFKDAALKEPLSYAAYYKTTQESGFNTVLVTQPDGSEKETQVFVSKTIPHDIKLFRVKQILSYNEKTNRLDLTPIAIAPLTSTYNKEKQLISTTPLFWVSIKSINQAVDLNQSSINWAKRMIRSIHTEEVRVIKGKETLAEILNEMIDGYVAAANSSQLYEQYYDGLHLMSPQKIEALTNEVDTIITFDPKTFEEIVSQVKTPVTPKTLSEVRIVQDWFWNKETQRVSIRLVAFAPILKRYDSKDNFIYSGPLCYKKNKG